MKLDQPRGAFLIQKKIAHVIGDRFRGRQRIERWVGTNAKIFARAGISRRTRRNQTQHRFGKGERFGLEGIQHG